MTEIEEEVTNLPPLRRNESRRTRFNLARNESPRISGLPLGRNPLFLGGNPFKNYLDESELFPYKNNIDQEEKELFNELQSFFEWHPGKNHLYYFAHEHRMAFYHDTNNRKIKCSACDEAIDYAMYGCPESECQTRWFHKSCAELPGKIEKHPFHTQHPLVKQMNSDPSRRCSGCQLPLGEGDFYGCTDSQCKIFFHKFCLELPREIKYFRHSSHPLSLEQELGKTFRCNACSADHTGLNYSCKWCDYNLGIPCIGKEAAKRDGNPKGHFLTFFRKPPSEHRKSTVCLVCRGRFNLQQAVFHCKECKFSLHRDCVLPVILPFLPDTFVSKKHPAHPLTLFTYFDVDYDSTLGWQVCDVCDQRIPRYASFYYCKDCDFAEDLTCVLSEVTPPFLSNV